MAPFDSNPARWTRGIAVAALSPRAGDGGHFGNEEDEIVTPAIRKAQEHQINVSGPWPSDTVYLRAHNGEFDVVLSMYHDQGLPVLKHAGFGKAVNITLGLPFIRTSVDHGTALDIAGKNLADAGSMYTAAMAAMEMCR